MLLYPLLVTVVSVVFAAVVWGQYRSRRRPHQLVWSCALGFSAVASLAYAVCVYLGGNAFFFRVYYVAGALLMAGWLGQGSVYLALSRRAAGILAWVLGFLSLVGTVALFVAPLDAARLHSLAGGPGTGVLLHGNALGAVALGSIILVNTYGAAAVVLVALWSIWRLLRRRGPVRFAVGNALIAVGAIVNSTAGTLARLGHGAGFWLTMTVGGVLIFGGFLTMAGGGGGATNARRGS